MPGTDAANAADELRRLGERGRDVRIDALMAADPARAGDFALRVGPVYANFSRQRYDRDALRALFALFERLDAPARQRALFDGEPVNNTEGRAALHTALRGDLSAAPAARAARAQALAARSAMADVASALAAQGVTDVVSVGIGGSDLGPRLAVDALSGGGVRVHFLSNVDGHAAQRVLAALSPAQTAVLLVSKSFGTQETLLNGALLREWLGDDSRLYAITANAERAGQAFGIDAARVLPMWDWVGGRYSLWSAVGLSVALSAGMERFDALLAGAALMDQHVLHASCDRNLAVWHAATAVFNRNALGLCTHAVLPYDERLRLLPAYLQQLVMESLGKSVTRDGAPVAMQTVPVWWGGAGTDAQHSFFQALHQGTAIGSADFIGVVRADAPHAGNHHALLANLLAQSEALATGRHSDDPHRHYPGNRPGTVLLLDSLTPESLGALLALYEHSVFLQALVWDINPFDQFGVELGKQLADSLLPAVRGEARAADPATQALLDAMRR